MTTFPVEALNERLDRLSEHPFYRGRLPARVSDAADFAASVPLMGRGDLSVEMSRPGYGAFGGVSPVRINLSPVDGKLMPILQTEADLKEMVAAARRHLGACGIGEGDVCAVTFGYHLFVAGLFYQAQMEAHGVACLPLGPGEPARTAELCARNGVTVLAGNPSFALRLIEEGLNPPKVFFAGGEAFTCNTTLYDAVRAAMPDTMLVDSFSLSEFLPVARTFPGGTGVHVFDELVLAEVIDPETGEPAAEGERGELVLTHLRKEAQPLLRYRTGDLTILRETEPVCGRRVNLPQVVFGRTDNMVKVKGVKFYPSEVRTILLGLDGLTGRYRVTISGKPKGGDRITLILEGSGGEETGDTIASRFKERMLISADQVAFTDALEDGPLLTDERSRGETRAR